MKKRVVGFAALCASVSAVAAERPSYVGADALQWTFEAEHAEDASAIAPRITLGAEFTDHLGAAWHFAAGGSDTVLVDTPVGSGEVTIENEMLASFFARAQFEPVSRLRLYGLAGYTMGRLEARAAGESIGVSDDDPSYGAGAEWQVTDGWSLAVSYVDYLRGDNYDLRATSAGIRVEF